MPNSMTAYANTRVSHPWGALSWELRSVNHRFLVSQFHLPDSLQHLEMPLRETLSKSIRRGKVDCLLTLKQEATDPGITFDEQAARQYITAAEQIAAMIDSPAPLNPLDILDRPGIRCRMEVDIEVLNASVTTLYEQALSELVEAREREGNKLAEVIRRPLLDIRKHTQAVREAMPTLLNAQQQKLKDKLCEFGERLDHERLEQELVYMAQRADVAEELDRLEVHVEEIERVLDGTQAMGRRLDFLVQELNREANTLASKTLSSTTSYSAVELKVLIEQIREQVQNIE